MIPEELKAELEALTAAKGARDAAALRRSSAVAVVESSNAQLAQAEAEEALAANAQDAARDALIAKIEDVY